MRFVIDILLLLPLLSAAAEFVWAGEPYHVTSSDLPASGSQTCCGSHTIGDAETGQDAPTCLCDLTVGQCDTECCCDPDCASELLAAGGSFACTSPGTATRPRSYTLCSDQTSSLAAQQGQDTGLTASFGGADGLLCVVDDNSIARGAFFRDPAPKNRLNAPVGDYIQAVEPVQFFAEGGDGTSWLTSSEPTRLNYYEIGTPVYGDGCLSHNSTTGCTSRSPTLLPSPTVSGACAGAQEIPFLRDVPPFTCDLSAEGKTLEQLCATSLNPAFLSSAAFASAPDDASVLVSTFEILDASSGAVLSSPPGQSVWLTADGTCSNALLLYQLRLTVANAGTITKVQAYVATGNVSSLAQLSTTYGAAFEYETSTAPVRPTSGRPGYVRGLPLLVSDGPQVRTGGLQLLPRSPLGACATQPTDGGSTTALFGEASAVTCTTTVASAQLQSLCDTSTSFTAQPLVASLNLTAASLLGTKGAGGGCAARGTDVPPSSCTMIGVYGDSHPDAASTWDTSDWVPLSVRYHPVNDASELTQRWDATDQKCKNMLSGIHLRVLTTKVGATTAPIHKVSGAELILTTRDVSAKRCALGATDCTTTTSVTATVTFTELDTDSFEFVPQAPQLIPPLPYDFFYPFYVGESR